MSTSEWANWSVGLISKQRTCNGEFYGYRASYKV